MQLGEKSQTFLMVIEGNETIGFSALLPDVPGFFVAGSTLKEIDEETADALPRYIEYLQQKEITLKSKTRTESQMALTIPLPHEVLSLSSSTFYVPNPEARLSLQSIHTLFHCASKRRLTF
jgi:predicted RNase H-like HicB family nuclease